MLKRCPKCSQSVEVSSVLPVDTLCPKCGGRIPYADASPPASAATSDGVRAEKPQESPQKPAPQGVRAEKPTAPANKPASTGVRTTKSSPVLPPVPKLEDVDADRPIEDRVRPIVVAPPAKSGKPWLLLIAGVAIGLMLAGGCVGVGIVIFSSRPSAAPQPPMSYSEDSQAMNDLPNDPALPPEEPRPPETPTKPNDPTPPMPAAPATGMKLPAIPTSPTLEPVQISGTNFAIELGGQARRVMLAGGGRYLVVLAAAPPQNLQRLLVIDIAKKQVEGILDVDPDIHVAAGMNHVFTYSATRKVLERFELPILRRDIARPATPSESITGLCMGHASNGPLQFAASQTAGFFNADDLSQLPAVYARAGDQMPGGRWWAAPNGRAFGNIAPDGKASLWRIENDKLRRISISTSQPKFVLTDVAGSKVFVGNGIAALPSAGNSTDSVSVLSLGAAPFGLPAQAGEAVIAIQNGPGMGTLPGPDGGMFPRGPRPGGGPPIGPGGPPPFPGPGKMPPGPGGPGTSGFTVVGDGRLSLALLSNRAALMLAGVDLAVPTLGEAPPLEERVYFLPGAQVLVALSTNRDKIWLYKVDSSTGITTVQKESLKFLTTTPFPARRGRLWIFSSPILVPKIGAAANVMYDLRDAPSGMTIDNSGRIQWNVPADFSVNQIQFTVVARDISSAAEATQLVTVSVIDAKAAAGLPSAPLLLSGLDEYEPPMPMTRSPIISSTDIKLPDPIQEIVVGAGGRFLLLRPSNKQVLHIVDVGKPLLAQSIPLRSAQSIVVAGGSHFYIIDPKSGEIERVSFANLTNRENLPPLPAELRAQAFEQVFAAMGDESPGPLFWAMPASGKVFQIDPRTMKYVAIPFPEEEVIKFASFAAAPDGRTICAIGRDSNANPVVAVLRNGIATLESLPEYRNRSSLVREHYLVPSADAELFFSSDMVWGRETYLPYRGSDSENWAPAREPGFFVRSTRDYNKPNSRKLQIGRIGADPQRKGQIVILGSGNVTLNDQQANSHNFHQRVHYYPSLGLLTALSADTRRLIFQPADAGTLLDRSTRFVFPLCRPPRFVKPGKEISIPALSRASSGQSTLTLISGPVGMKLGNQKLTWNVPDSLAGSDVEFTLRARDSIHNRETTQKYSISVLPNAVMPMR